MPSPTSILLLTIGAIFLPLVCAATDNSDVPPGSILAYRPSIAASIIYGVLYLAAGAGLFWHTITRKDWWGICLPIGASLQGIGFILRLQVRASPASLSLYIVDNFLIVLSPATYLAFNYIFFGRLAASLRKDRTIERRSDNLTYIPARLMGRIFILSDVTTFLIQAAGGSLETSKGPAGKVGSKIFLLGIILQGLSYVFFISLAIRCHWCVGGFSKGPDPNKDHYGNVSRLFAVLYFSSVFIIIRSAYRIVELAQGFSGFLITHEIYFLLLDSLPLIIAILIYIPFWPTKLYPLLKSAYAVIPASEDYPIPLQSTERSQRKV